MNYSLSTSQLTIEVTKTGIELCSVKLNATDKEYIWQADPGIWPSHAPVLFPIIGALKDGNFIFKGNHYPLPKHGFVRHSDKPKLINKTENSLHFQFTWDEETYQIYPFKFVFDLIYKVRGTTIEVIHQVKNVGETPLYYSLGGHPAFNCPLNPGEEYQDYFLEFEHAETLSSWLIDKNGLLSGETKSILQNSDTLPLHEKIFDQDALVFKDIKSRKVSLVSKKFGEVLSVSFNDFPFLGLWAKPAAPFICIEPWLGVADSANSNQDFRTKEGIRELEPGLTDTKTYSITIA